MNWILALIITVAFWITYNHKIVFNKIKSSFLKEVKLTSKTMKTSQIVSSTEALNSLITQKMPAALSFKISLLTKKLEPIIKSFNDVRSEKVQELGDKIIDDDGKETGNYKFSDENGIKFKEELEALLNQDVEVEIPEIKISDLGSILIEPATISTLDWLIKE